MLITKDYELYSKGKHLLSKIKEYKQKCKLHTVPKLLAFECCKCKGVYKMEFAHVYKTKNRANIPYHKEYINQLLSSNKNATSYSDKYYFSEICYYGCKHCFSKKENFLRFLENKQLQERNTPIIPQDELERFENEAKEMIRQSKGE